jgi:hypothetical protein
MHFIFDPRVRAPTRSDIERLERMIKSMDNKITPLKQINGHDSVHALQEQRNAKQQVASALYKSLQFLQAARMIAIAHGLTTAIPGDAAIADAYDTLMRDLNGDPPRAA